MSSGLLWSLSFTVSSASSQDGTVSSGLQSLNLISKDEPQQSMAPFNDSLLISSHNQPQFGHLLDHVYTHFQDRKYPLTEPIHEYMLVSGVFVGVQRLIALATLALPMWVSKTIINNDIYHPPIIILMH